MTTVVHWEDALAVYLFVIVLDHALLQTYNEIELELWPRLER